MLGSWQPYPGVKTLGCGENGVYKPQVYLEILGKKGFTWLLRVSRNLPRVPQTTQGAMFNLTSEQQIRNSEGTECLQKLATMVNPRERNIREPYEGDFKSCEFWTPWMPVVNYKNTYNSLPPPCIHALCDLILQLLLLRGEVYFPSLESGLVLWLPLAKRMWQKWHCTLELLLFLKTVPLNCASPD